jgi:hypothetical protein
LFLRNFSFLKTTLNKAKYEVFCKTFLETNQVSKNVNGLNNLSGGGFFLDGAAFAMLLLLSALFFHGLR